jgi:CAAX prenyl protease-like protein
MQTDNSAPQNLRKSNLDAMPVGNPIVPRALPFALFMAALALRGLVTGADSGLGSFDTRWFYGAQIAVSLVPIVFWWRVYGELRNAPRSATSLVVCVAAGLGVFFLWIAPMPGWMHLGAPVASFVPADADGALRWDLIAMRALGAVLVVPLMEELFWRSFLMRWIDRRDFLSLAPAAVSWVGVIASSVVFGLEHDLWLGGLAAGLVYAQLYRRLGNLWYAILAHATTNLALAAWVIHQRNWAYW